MSKVIVLAAPVFALLIVLELAWGVAKGRNTYRLPDAIASIGLGLMSQFTGVFSRLLRVGIYAAVAAHLSLVPAESAQAFWTSPAGWVLALVFYDFCYYWLHRLGHECAVLWAAHVVHHQSQDYNLSTALRQTSSGHLFGWIFYLPMALAGVPPMVFGIVALIDLLYQFWVHTEHVPRLGWFDRWFCSPSNHRVHHAVNDRYLDRNYGGILVVWDRLFGSFQPETEPCVYGTRSPLRSWDPLWANAEVYAALFRDAWHARSWADKLRVFLKPPGWRPADVAARFPRPVFDLATARTKYGPPVGRAAAWFGGAGFALLLGAVAAFLWWADTMSPAGHLAGVATLSALLWATTAVLQGRLGVWMGAAAWAAAIATGSACLAMLSADTPERAASWLLLHRVFKPLGVGLAMVAVLAAMVAVVGSRASARGSGLAAPSLGASGTVDGHGMPARGWLVAALALSVMGDAWLMFPGFFVQGLASFLLAHLCFLVVYRQGVGWFPSRAALAVSLAYGAAMFAYLLPHLGAGLRMPVAAYVLVIALMGAQAVGRALVRGTVADRWIAAGAVLFMASDSLLAVNRFVAPIPLSPLWILSTYFTAQLLMARHAGLPPGPRAIPSGASTP